MPYPATNLNEAVELLVPDSNTLHEIINGDASTEVPLPEGGTAPSVRKALVDGVLFKNPILWNNGQNITDPLQLVTFTNGIQYYAPTATSTSPVPMGATPEDDNNWKIAPINVEELRTYKGTWTPASKVSTGDVFEYQGSEWRSVTGANVEPVEGNDWRSLNNHSNLTNRDDPGAHNSGSITHKESSVFDYISNLEVDSYVNIKNADLYGDQSASILISRRQRRTDNHIWFLGDSHGWGEGSTEYVSHTILDNNSVHAPRLGNRSFIQQAIDKIYDTRGWSDGTYLSVNTKIDGYAMTGDYSRGKVGANPEITIPVNLVCGAISSNTIPLAESRTRACDNFYRPLAFNDVYSVTQYRENISKNRFSANVMELRHESVSEFYPDTKKHYYTFPVNVDYPAGEPNFVDVLGDGGAVIATRSSTGATYIVTTPNQSLPIWLTSGSRPFIQGYGRVKIGSQAANGIIRIKNLDDSNPDVSILKYFHQGMKFYHGSYITNAVVSVDFNEHKSRAYIAVRTGPNRGVMRVGFTEGITDGGLIDPYLSSATMTNRANSYSPTNKPSGFRFFVYSMNQDGSFNNTDASIDNTSNQYVDFNCETAEEQEVIYVVDFGGRTTGRLFIESLDSEKSVALRGVVFDNNYAVNHAFGGHTIGAWLGRTSSFSNETRDHIADLLKYTPVRPSSVVVQVPFVNEYLKQTSIASFISDLEELTARINSHMPNGQNQLGTQFIFYTSLRNREIAFSGASQSTITYDMYKNAVKDFCISNGHEYVDIEDKLLNIPSLNGLPFERLFYNSNHPSDLANMLISEELAYHVMTLG